MPEDDRNFDAITAHDHMDEDERIRAGLTVLGPKAKTPDSIARQVGVDPAELELMRGVRNRDDFERARAAIDAHPGPEGGSRRSGRRAEGTGHGRLTRMGGRGYSHPGPRSCGVGSCPPRGRGSSLGSPGSARRLIWRLLDGRAHRRHPVVA